MKTTLRQLTKLVSPPVMPVEPLTHKRQESLEKTLKIHLPNDYIELSQTYGSGVFRHESSGDPLVFLNPGAKNYLQELESYQQIYRELQEEEIDEYPFGLYPEAEGLLFIGSSQSRRAVFYLSKGKPDQWPLVILSPEQTWVTLETHLQTFLIKLMHGDYRHEFSKWFAPNKMSGSEPQIKFESSRSELTIHQAVLSNDVDQIKLLASSGADMNSIDANGFTPLTLANEVKTIRLLLSLGANPNTCDATGYTPLMAASRLCLPLVAVNLLLKAGAKVNIGDETGKTPLMYASAVGCFPIVELLLKNGADPLLKTSDGETALTMSKRHPSVTKLIRSAMKK